MAPPVDTAAAPPSPRYEVMPWGCASAYAGAPSPRKILVVSAGVVRALDKAEFSIVESMPDDLMQHILIDVWLSWPRATRALRVSKGVAECATMARGQLPPGEWWTGSGLPLQVPAAPCEEIDLAAALPQEGVTRLNVMAADVHDVHRTLLRVRAAALRPSTARFACSLSRSTVG